jgi:hypothetical protein
MVGILKLRHFARNYRRVVPYMYGYPESQPDWPLVVLGLVGFVSLLGGLAISSLGLRLLGGWWNLPGMGTEALVVAAVILAIAAGIGCGVLVWFSVKIVFNPLANRLNKAKNSPVPSDGTGTVSPTETPRPPTGSGGCWSGWAVMVKLSRCLTGSRVAGPCGGPARGPHTTRFAIPKRQRIPRHATHRRIADGGGPQTRRCFESGIWRGPWPVTLSPCRPLCCGSTDK